MTGQSRHDSVAQAARLFDRLDEGSDAFDRLAASVYRFQREENPVYGRYCKALEAAGDQLVPYLPIAAFKHSPVTTFPPETAEHVFESSGTGSGIPSRHFVKDLSLYDRAIDAHFERVFGSGKFVFATHLPHYVEMGSRSSLLYMAERLVARFGVVGSGSFLKDPERFDGLVRLSRETKRQLIVFGAAFGLLDFVEAQPRPLPPDALVIETGGMKTFRREIGRAELHERLASGFEIDPSRIWSEYGMCELLSQCYTRGGREFYPPPWMRFQVLDVDDPLHEVDEDRTGVLGIFDLANSHTVSAILTEDRAVRRGSGFEVIGRLSGAELRGCNFLLENV